MHAKHQHYVPRHLLRGFLSDNPEEAAKERVRVFDLQSAKSFTTKINNVMGEHRFNEWWADEDTIISVDPSIEAIEHQVVPLIDRLREQRRLNLSAEEHQDIAVLLGLQFTRAKAMRQMFVRFEDQLRRHVEKRGGRMEQVEGWEPLTEEKLKRDHIRQLVNSFPKYVEHMADKVFFLMTPPPGESLYLGDNPVVMANDVKSRPFGNLGLNVPYIQLYIPIAHDLMLCAYSREVLGRAIKQSQEMHDELRRNAFDLMWKGAIGPDGMKRILAEMPRDVDEFIGAIRAGESVPMQAETVAGYNSLQAFYAVRYVVDRRGSFAVAREAVKQRAECDLRERSEE